MASSIKATTRAEKAQAEGVQTDVGIIYTQHQSALRRFISDRVDSPEEGEDILQTVFYNLSRIDLSENPIIEISAWLYRSVRNQIIDRRRKKKEEAMPRLKGHGDDEEFLSDISEILASPDETPEGSYLHSLVWERLEIALAELPAGQREVFELTELEGFSVREIVEATGIPAATITSRKHYAVLHLRDRLRDLYQELIESC